MAAYFSQKAKLGLFDILDWGCTFKLIINFFNLCWNADCKTGCFGVWTNIKGKLIYYRLT